VIDAAGLVVAPGFIDLHAHGQDTNSNRFQVADGVTTALELEIGVYPVAPWYASREGKAPIHFGATASHPAARISALTGVDVGNLVYADPTAAPPEGENPAIVQLNADQLAAVREKLKEGLGDRALGVGVGLAYTPGADAEEMFHIFATAAEANVPLFIHLRNAQQRNDDKLATVQEALANAATTGASLHIVHLNSSTDEKARTALDMIRGAQARGLDVTTESYPYTAGSTRLESALFDNYQGDYADLQWVATGERLTKETFDKYRATGGWVIIHGREESTNTYLVAQEDVMVASDGIPFVDGFSHPRSAGTFARILGRYVRDKEALTLMTALRKMTLMPAQRLEAVAPAMKTKGRLQTGMDADITIFDPETILDRATYEEPDQTSTGIPYVVVSGVVVVDDGEVMQNVYPGQAIRGER